MSNFDPETMKLTLALTTIVSCVISIAFVIGHATALSSIRQECRDFGRFEMSGTVYKCDEALTK